MNQYLRHIGLIVTKGTDGLDLSNMRIQFQTYAPDADAPPTALIRVYNLTQDHAKQIQKEYQSVMLQAGYLNGNYGIIFKGTIKQIRRGRQNATDTFVDIMAADGDEGYNFGFVNKSLKSGSTQKDQLDAIFQSTQQQGLEKGSIPNDLGTGGTLPRGKVLFGLAREKLTDVSNSSNATWSIQDGKVNIIPLTGYLDGEIVVINARTGMIGIPEATNNGIEVMCLLNPLLRTGRRVKLDNASINQTTIRDQGFPRYSDLNFPANVSDDGMYRVLVIEHKGDTRGNDWQSSLTCLAVDPSAKPTNSVLPYG